MHGGDAAYLGSVASGGYSRNGARNLLSADFPPGSVFPHPCRSGAACGDGGSDFVTFGFKFFLSGQSGNASGGMVGLWLVGEKIGAGLGEPPPEGLLGELGWSFEFESPKWMRRPGMLRRRSHGARLAWPRRRPWPTDASGRGVCRAVFLGADTVVVLGRRCSASPGIGTTHGVCCGRLREGSTRSTPPSPSSGGVRTFRLESTQVTFPPGRRGGGCLRGHRRRGRQGRRLCDPGTWRVARGAHFGMLFQCGGSSAPSPQCPS